MEWFIIFFLVGLLTYFIYHEVHGDEMPTPLQEGKLCDYYVPGSVFEPVSSALARGVRLIELHVYSDEQDHPVVAKHPLQDGYDYAEDNIPFSDACITLVNEAFPSKYPLILSIVPHTEKSTTLNSIADHIGTTLRKTLVSFRDSEIVSAPISSLAGKTIIVSGGNIQGTRLDDIVNLSWTGSAIRRLSYTQATSPRDPIELYKFNKVGISIVGPDPVFNKGTVDAEKIKSHGCQWNLYDSGSGMVKIAGV